MDGGENYAKELARELAEAKQGFLLGIAADPGLQTSDVKLALVLAVEFVNRASFEASGEMWAWPSVETLKRRTSVSDRTVMRSLVRLQRKGWIAEVVSQRGPGKSNRYRLKRPNLTSLCHVFEPPSDCAASRGGKIENLTSQVSNTCHLSAEKPDTAVSPDLLEGNLEQQPSNAPSALNDDEGLLGKETDHPPDPFSQMIPPHFDLAEASAEGARRQVRSLQDQLGMTAPEAWVWTMENLDGHEDEFLYLREAS